MCNNPEHTLIPSLESPLLQSCRAEALLEYRLTRINLQRTLPADTAMDSDRHDVLVDSQDLSNFFSTASNVHKFLLSISPPPETDAEGLPIDASTRDQLLHTLIWLSKIAGNAAVTLSTSMDMTPESLKAGLELVYAGQHLLTARKMYQRTPYVPSSQKGEEMVSLNKEMYLWCVITYYFVTISNIHDVREPTTGHCPWTAPFPSPFPPVPPPTAVLPPPSPLRTPTLAANDDTNDDTGNIKSESCTCPNPECKGDKDCPWSAKCVNDTSNDAVTQPKKHLCFRSDCGALSCTGPTEPESDSATKPDI